MIDSNAYYMPGGEPFFFRGSDTGCLLVHGITATPQEMLWLGKHLHAERGYTIYGPRVVGHGTHPENLVHIKWQDWYGSVLDGYRILRQQCNQVFVMGLSNGGLLSLHLGTHEKPDAIVSMAGPIVLDHGRLPYARYLKYVRPYKPYIQDEHFHRIDSRMREIQAQKGESIIGRMRYSKDAVAGYAELYTMAAITQSALANLTSPLLLIYSEKDETVPFRNMALIASKVGTPAQDLHQLALKESSHLLTLDIEMETVFETVTGFLDHYTVS